MNRQLLYSIVVLFLTTFLAKAQVGITCENPIVISALPFQAMDNTGNYGNSVLGPQLSSCIPGGTNYQSGNDVFYSYTAVENATVSFTLSTTQTRSSLFLYPSCSGITGNCLAAVGNNTNYPRIINYNVVAGATYIILISSNSQTPIIQYDLLIQKENCTKPTNLMVSDTALTSATFSWSSEGNPISHQVAVQPQGSLVPSGAGQYSGITNSTFTPTDLNAATLYQYWVRSECSPGVFSAWAGPYLFNTVICTAAAQCDYTFRMTDTANNGWNGARMKIRQNGIVVATIGGTYTSGAGPVDVIVPLCNDVPIDVFWEVAGSQPHQCVLSIVNSFGQTIGTVNGANATVGTVIYLGTINCTYALCNLAPTNVTFNPTTTGETINWEAPGTENVGFDVYIVPTGGLSPTMTTLPTYSGVNGPAAPFSYTIPSLLLPDTSYDVYVRVQCDDPSDSPWSAVTTFTTLPTCPKPIEQTVTEIVTNSAVLGWTEAASASQWEVLLLSAPNGIEPAAPALNPAVGPNDLYFQNLTGATTLLPTLQPATIYYYYVRAVCQPGSDKSTWTGPFIFNTITCNASEKCTYRFILTNTTNNSWNSGRMQVRQNGIVVATLGTGGINNPNGIEVSICNDVPFDLYWSEAGTLPQDIGVSLIDVNNDIVFTKLAGQGTALTVLYSDTILENCAPPSCPKPINLLANASQVSVQLSWEEVGSATQWEVYIATDAMAQPVNGTAVSNIAPYYIANINTNFTVNGLVPSTAYTFYVRAICSGVDHSTWTLLNPVSFNTTPVNDDCAAAINIPVNPSPQFLISVAGTTLGGTASAEISTCPGNENDDVWFSFVATNAIQVVELKNIIGSTTNLRFAIYAGNVCETMTQLFCSATGNNKGVLTNLVVGEVYKIRVYTNGANPTESAAFDISVTTPPPPGPNDEPINAIAVPINPLSECVYVTPGNLIGATATATVPSGCAGTANDDVWFSFIATSDTQIINILNIEGTTTDLNHAVLTGTYDNLTLFYCSSQNASSSNNSNFIVGQNYFLRVWSAGSTNQVVTFDVCIKPVSTCATAAPFCAGSFGDPYIFPNTTGIPNNVQVACLGSIPNPTYYTLNVSQTGPLNFTIFQNTNINGEGQLLGNPLDVDFVAWGPFASPQSCDQIVFADCPTCPNNTNNPAFYPLGNIVDCSYSASYTETVSIPNAQAGEYYVLLLTNFSGQPGYISLMQDNYNDPGAGATSCGDVIQLVSFIDANNNGVKEETESKFTYGSFTFQKNNTGATYYVTNPMGVQNIYDANTANTYDFDFTINSEYAAYYAETPTSFNDLSIPFGSGVQTLYFPITITQTYSDIDVSIVPIGAPRPGFQYTQKIVYRNLGIAATSGTLTFAKGNATIAIAEILPAATSVTTEGFSYDFINLAPGETQIINVKMTVPVIPIVNLGDVATTTVSISSPDVDVNTNNNSFVTNQVVVASYDPNDKNEARGATVNINQFTQDDYLFYTIRFQNTGTASAETVRIEDLLASEFDFASIRMISASHHYSMERINNKLVWTFNNINLLPAVQNDLLSQGYVSFKIKLNAGFAVGDVIQNTAAIYFDFNPPIITNTFETTFVPNLSAGSFDASNLVVYPNPAREVVQITLRNSVETISRIVIYDIIGKAIKTISGTNEQQATVNVSDLSKGVYMIEITTDSHLKQIRKFIVN
ncbi:DUF7619 domain-containing protein [Flavobacterium sp. SM2513]|uniref:T9SS type A sorting domain-containing protein n=1 Tax=Flavobacterium sp. SM2513 TaxID=3424766 RepID=UPI003D7F85A3